MNRYLFYLLVLFLCLLVCGCVSSSGPMPLGKDGFMITTSAHGTFNNPRLAIEGAIKEANEHCASMGKVFHSIDTQIQGTPGWPGGAKITYRCIDETAIQEAKNNVKSCFEALDSDDEIAPIKSKVSLVGAMNQPFSMLIDNSTPTPEEQKAIFAWANKRDICSKEISASMDKEGMPRVMKNVAISGYSTSRQLIADLYNLKLTYGEFARKREQIAQLVNESMTNIQIELQKESAESKARADQLALQAKQNMIMTYQANTQRQQTQQMINQQQQMINQQQQQINQQHVTMPGETRLRTMCNIVGNTMFCY